MAEDKESQALIVKNSAIVLPAVTPDEAKKSMEEYQNLKKSIIDEKSDVQDIAGEKFLKKSYWRKLATFFNITVDVVEEKHEMIGGNIIWHFICKAVAPNGRSSIGSGSCDQYEKATKRGDKWMKKGEVTKWGKNPKTGKSFPMEFNWMMAEPNSIHNTRSTAETRAFNRAVSNLVGGGEVSAEEVNGNDYYEQKQPPKTQFIAATTAQITTILTLGEKLGQSEETMLSFVTRSFKAKSWAELSKTGAARIIDHLNKRLAEKEKEKESAEPEIVDDHSHEIVDLDSEGNPTESQLEKDIKELNF